MIDPDTMRASIAGWLTNAGGRSDLTDLTELGVVHFTVLTMLSERIQHLYAAGYSKAAIHEALSDETVLARTELGSDPAPSTGPGRHRTGAEE